MNQDKASFPNSVNKWYLRPVVIVIAILAAGPLALPLLWISPAFKRWHKVAISTAVVAITFWLVKATADLYGVLSKEMAELRNIMQK